MISLKLVNMHDKNNYTILQITSNNIWPVCTRIADANTSLKAYFTEPKRISTACNSLVEYC